MKPTAVEWLINQLHKKQNKQIDISFNDIFDQAKEMEKQQIAHSWAASLWSKEIDQSFEEYYNETYKSEQ